MESYACPACNIEGGSSTTPDVGTLKCPNCGAQMTHLGPAVAAKIKTDRVKKLLANP